MKTKFQKIAMLTLALLTLGGVSMQAETVTDVILEYNYAQLATDKLSYGGSQGVTRVTKNTINGTDVYTFTCGAIITSDDVLLNNGSTILRYRDVNYLGLYGGGTYTITFGIKNLKANDKIEVAYNQSSDAMTGLYNVTQTVGSSTFTHNWTYDDNSKSLDYTVYTLNVTTDGDVLFTLPVAAHIGKIRVSRDRETTTIPITVGIIPDASVEEYDFQALGQAQASDGIVGVTFGSEKILTSPADIFQISFGGNTFYNRFAGNRDWAIRKNSDAKYCGLCTSSGWSSRYLAICNLKVGDKVSVKFVCDSEQSLIFQNAIVEGVSANDAVVSETEYVVTTAGALILDESSNTQDKRVYIYKVTIAPAAARVGNYIGTTLVSNYALDFSTVDDVTAYVATSASAGSVTFSPVTKVVANTPLYLRANETRGAVLNVNVPEAEEGAVDYSSTNLLKGSASTTKSLTSTDATKYYAFGVQDGEAGFYLVPSSDSFTSAAGKAYLELTAEQASAESRLAFNFVDGETTGISESVSKAATDGRYYDLQGRRVALPTKGLYIVNGKKVIVK